MSYEAIVARVKTREHPNADKLQLGLVNGYTVSIGIDVPDGTIGVYFPCDGQVSPEFAEANDLIGYSDPDTGERKGGFFAKNRRVRSVKLRGEKSEGYWTTFDSFAFTGYDMSQLKEGDKFDKLGDIPICNKYFTPATLKQMNSKQIIKRLNKQFPKHIETEKLQYEVHKIKPGSIIYITEKLHGTSARYAFVRDEKVAKRTWKDKLFRRPAKVTNDYDLLIGTRNMILGKSDVPSYYGSEEFRYRVAESFKDFMHKDEVIYGEVVGYTHTGASIMGEHDNTQIKDIKKAYGPKMVYNYGCIPGQFAFYVYRIARVNEDGFAVDLPWPQVKARATELGLKTVPEMEEVPKILYSWDSDEGKEQAQSWLLRNADIYMEGPSTLSDAHIREGVVFRVEGPDGKIDYYKSKSFTFGVLEGYIKDRDDYVDTEEVA